MQVLCYLPWLLVVLVNAPEDSFAVLLAMVDRDGSLTGRVVDGGLVVFSARPKDPKLSSIILGD